MAYRNPHNSSNVGALLGRDVSYRDRMKQDGNLQNHISKNAKAIREIEAKRRADKENEAKPSEMFKMKQFKEVKSRVFEEANRRPSGRLGSARDQQSRGSERSAGPDGSRRGSFLRRGAREVLEDKNKEARLKRAQEAADKEAEKQYAQAKEAKKNAVPRRNEVNKLAERSEKNFLANNRMDAIQAAPKPRGGGGEAAAAAAAAEGGGGPPGGARHKEFGQKPAYLQRRQEQWAREEALRTAALPDPDCPPGMVKMPDEERRATLETLRANEAEARGQLDRLPLVVQVPSMVRKQRALEEKLKEIEEAIKIFSRPKVYIADG